MQPAAAEVHRKSALGGGQCSSAEPRPRLHDQATYAGVVQALGRGQACRAAADNRNFGVVVGHV